MPIYLNDLDAVSKVAGLGSALIVPCNMCPAVTVSVREKKPFIQFFRSFLKSVPFEQHIRKLQSQLSTDFRSGYNRHFDIRFLRWFYLNSSFKLAPSNQESVAGKRCQGTFVGSDYAPCGGKSPGGIHLEWPR